MPRLSIVSQALWYALGLAALACVFSLRVGANWLALVPLFLTGFPLSLRNRPRAEWISLVCTMLYLAWIAIAIWSIGRMFIPSFLALVVALLLQVAKLRTQTSFGQNAEESDRARLHAP
jgi:hypothetical protein